MSHDPTFQELLEYGELGDRTLDLRLTVREAAALQQVVTCAAQLGVITFLLERTADADLDESFSIAFRTFEAKLGLRVARAIAARDLPEYETLVTALAELDAELAAWREKGARS